MGALGLDPFTEIINVHWAGGIWTWQTSFSVDCGFNVFFPTAFTIWSNVAVPFPIQSSTLMDYDGTGHNSHVQRNYLDANGNIYGQGFFEQFVPFGGGGVADVIWQEQAFFHSKQQAEGFKAFGGLTQIQFQWQVDGRVFDPGISPPPGSTYFVANGVTTLRDPSGQPIVNLGNLQRSETIIWSPYISVSRIVLEVVFNVTDGSFTKFTVSRS